MMNPKFIICCFVIFLFSLNSATSKGVDVIGDDILLGVKNPKISDYFIAIPHKVFPFSIRERVEMVKDARIQKPWMMVLKFEDQVFFFKLASSFNGEKKFVFESTNGRKKKIFHLNRIANSWEILKEVGVK